MHNAQWGCAWRHGITWLTWLSWLTWLGFIKQQEQLKYNKNKNIFTLEKWHLTVSKSLLTQELLGYAGGGGALRLKLNENLIENCMHAGLFCHSCGVEIWWDKNGKFLFNLTKLQLSLSQSLLAQEFWNMESVESVCREAGWALCLKLNEN